MTGDRDARRFPDQPAGRWVHRFQDDTSFLNALAALIPNGPLRLRFLEFGVKHRLDRALVAYRADPSGDYGLWIDAGSGFLMTEPGLFDIPACMVMFDFDPDFNRSRVITLWSIRPLEPPSDAEDDSH